MSNDDNEKVLNKKTPKEVFGYVVERIMFQVIAWMIPFGLFCIVCVWLSKVETTSFWPNIVYACSGMICILLGSWLERVVNKHTIHKYK